VKDIVLKKRMERQRSREWTHAMHGLPDLWGVFDEQCQRRGIRIAKLCSILRNSMLNAGEEVVHQGISKKALSATAEWGGIIMVP